MNEETAYEQQCYCTRSVPMCPDTSAPTVLDTSAPVPICLTDSSALVPKCLGSEVSRVRSVCTPKVRGADYTLAKGAVGGVQTLRTREGNILL